jgi:hypothetical protein
VNQPRSKILNWDTNKPDSMTTHYPTQPGYPVRQLEILAGAVPERDERHQGSTSDYYKLRLKEAITSARGVKMFKPAVMPW